MNNSQRYFRYLLYQGYDIHQIIKLEEKNWDKILDKIDEKDRYKRKEWKGQFSADEQYEGEYMD